MRTGSLVLASRKDRKWPQIAHKKTNTMSESSYTSSKTSAHTAASYYPSDRSVDNTSVDSEVQETEVPVEIKPFSNGESIVGEFLEIVDGQEIENFLPVDTTVKACTSTPYVKSISDSTNLHVLQPQLVLRSYQKGAHWDFFICLSLKNTYKLIYVTGLIQN